MPDRPPCLDAWHAALAYLLKKSSAFTGSWTPLLHAPVYQEAHAAIEAAIVAGDVTATKAACRVWWDVALGYAQAGQKEDAP